jgi:hypothetical protein
VQVSGVVLALTLAVATVASSAPVSSPSVGSASSSHTYWPAYPHIGERPQEINIDGGQFHATNGTVGPVPFVAVLGLKWAGWGGPTATANGTAVLDSPNGSGPAQDPISVAVTLSGQSPCGGANIYTDVSVSAAPGASAPGWDFARTQQGTHHSCWPLDGCDEGTPTCLMSDYNFGHLPFGSGGRTDRSPFGPKTYTYRIRFHGWGSEQAVGEGLLVAGPLPRCATQHCSPLVYAVRWTLSNPRWCTGGVLAATEVDVGPGLNYTSAKVEAFGHGTRLTSGLRTLRRYDGLVPEIGRPGVPRYVDTSSSLTSGTLRHRVGCVAP